MSERPLNTDVAERLGISSASVSRFRGGSRVPRIDIMRKIEKVYGWTVAEQATAHGEGTYATEFEAAIRNQPKA